MTRERRIYDLGTKLKWDGKDRELEQPRGSFFRCVSFVDRINTEAYFHNTLSLFLSQTRNFYRSNIICQFVRD